MEQLNNHYILHLNRSGVPSAGGLDLGGLILWRAEARASRSWRNRPGLA
jgi:hypothetical protein